MKQITAREFLHRFAKTHGKLNPGQAVIITRHGKPLGQFVKHASGGLPLPNFRKDAMADAQPASVGDRLLRKLLADDPIS